VSHAALAMTPDGARFTLENEIFNAAGERAAVVRSTGGWLDLAARKLVVPAAALIRAMRLVTAAPSSSSRRRDQRRCASC
jgi:acyl-CoA thioester hydrolase